MKNKTYKIRNRAELFSYLEELSKAMGSNFNELSDESKGLLEADFFNMVSELEKDDKSTLKEARLEGTKAISRAMLLKLHSMLPLPKKQ